jgi:hypothetical protein
MCPAQESASEIVLHRLHDLAFAALPLLYLSDTVDLCFCNTEKHYTSNGSLYGIDRSTCNPEANSCECPEGKELKYIGIKVANKSHIYRSTPVKRRDCASKLGCTTGRYTQLVTRVEGAVRQRARERSRHPVLFRQQQQRRKIQALFAELKNQIGLRLVSPEKNETRARTVLTCRCRKRTIVLGQPCTFLYPPVVSCSAMSLRYLRCRSRTRRGSVPSRFSALIAAG